VGHLGIQPSEFWGMTVQEFYLLYDTKREHDPEVDYAGGLTASACEDLYRTLH
jgi:hypothetical protein